MQSFAPLKAIRIQTLLKNHLQSCEKNTERIFFQYDFLPDVVLETVCHRDKYSGKQCQAVLRFDLCSTRGWLNLCCKTCEDASRIQI